MEKKTFLHITRTEFLSQSSIELFVGGLPLITYASRGGGGVNTNAYKCVQRGRGGLNMTKSTHCVRRFIKNATISEQGAQAGITTSYEVLYFLFILIYKMKLWK